MCLSYTHRKLDSTSAASEHQTLAARNMHSLHTRPWLKEICIHCTPDHRFCFLQPGSGVSCMFPSDRVWCAMYVTFQTLAAGNMHSLHTRPWLQETCIHYTPDPGCRKHAFIAHLTLAEGNIHGTPDLDRR